MVCIALLSYMFGVYWLNVLWYVVTGVMYTPECISLEHSIVSKALMSGQLVNNNELQTTCHIAR